MKKNILLALLLCFFVFEARSASVHELAHILAQNAQQEAKRIAEEKILQRYKKNITRAILLADRWYEKQVEIDERIFQIMESINPDEYKYCLQLSTYQYYLNLKEGIILANLEYTLGILTEQRRIDKIFSPESFLPAAELLLRKKPHIAESLLRDNSHHSMP